MLREPSDRTIAELLATALDRCRCHQLFVRNLGDGVTYASAWCTNAAGAIVETKGASRSTAEAIELVLENLDTASRDDTPDEPEAPKPKPLDAGKAKRAGHSAQRSQPRVTPAAPVDPREHARRIVLERVQRLGVATAGGLIDMLIAAGVTPESMPSSGNRGMGLWIRDDIAQIAKSLLAELVAEGVLAENRGIYRPASEPAGSRFVHQVLGGDGNASAKPTEATLPLRPPGERLAAARETRKQTESARASQWQRIALELVDGAGQTSRTVLARSLGVCLQTAGKVLDRLVEQHVLEMQRLQPSGTTGGRSKIYRRAAAPAKEP